MAGQQLPQPQQPFTDGQDRITRPWYAFLLTVQQWLGPLPGALSASTLLGRGASAAGAPEQITLGTGLSMTGTVLSSTAGGTVTHTGALSSGKAIIGNGGADITVSALTAQFVGSSSGTPAAASMSTARLLGRTTASSGAVEEITAGAGLTLSGGTLSASGTVGGLVLLDQHTASTSPSLNFTTCLSSTYDEYLVEFLNIVPATNAVNVLFRVSTDGGSSYDSGANYQWAGFRASNGGSAVTGSESTTSIVLDASGTQSNSSTTGGMNGWLRIFNPLSGAMYTRVKWDVGLNDGTGLASVNVIGTGGYKSTTAVNAFQVLTSAGNIASGTIRVYGLAK